MSRGILWQRGNTSAMHFSLWAWLGWSSSTNGLEGLSFMREL